MSVLVSTEFAVQDETYHLRVADPIDVGRDKGRVFQLQQGLEIEGN